MESFKRRIELIYYLCRKRQTTLTEISNHFGITVRTAQRDLLAINEYVQFYTKPGRYEGGIFVVEDFGLEKFFLPDTEIALLQKVLNLSDYFPSAVWIPSDSHTLLNMITKYTMPSIPDGINQRRSK